MTAGEFAKKYRIDYQTVRQATYRTPTRKAESWALDYPEDELIRAVEESLMYRRDWHRDRMTLIIGQLLRLREGAGFHEPDAGG